MSLLKRLRSAAFFAGRDLCRPTRIGAIPCHGAEILGMQKLLLCRDFSRQSSSQTIFHIRLEERGGEARSLGGRGRFGDLQKDELKQRCGFPTASSAAAC